MSRMTRAKLAKVAQELHVDEDALLAVPGDLAANAAASSAADRPPLGEIAHNSGIYKPGDEEAPETVKTGKESIHPKKELHDSRKHATAITSSTAITPSHSPDILPDNNESASSPARILAAEDLMKSMPTWAHWTVEAAHLPIHDIRPSSPTSNAVRLTRSELSPSRVSKCPEPKLLANEKVIAESRDADATPTNQQPRSTKTSSKVKDNEAAINNSRNSASNLGSKTTISRAKMVDSRQDSLVRLETPTKTPTDSKARDSVTGITTSPISYDDLEAAVVLAQATPSRPTTAPSTPQLQAPDPIAAIDALEDAVEQVNSEVPDVQVSPEKAKPAKEKSAAPVVRATKASQARISMAHGPKDTPRVPSLGRPRQSSALQSHGKRVTSTSSNQSSGSEAAEKKSVEIPHSKPRPMSMAFPTPPPPAKSTKAPTQSTFQLPGAAVAAKLKAAKEARLAKEVEENKRQPFKARPVPSTMSKPASVRQTSTSKARESFGGKPPAPLSALAHRRASSLVSKRTSTAKNASVGASLAPRPTSTAPTASITVAKRPSSVIANPMKKSRPSTAMAFSTSTTAPANRPASSVGSSRVTSGGTAKGKEVFNRAAQAKAAAEKERRDKEEAAKKARVEAAERSRQKSREWAEKQKLKKLGAKSDVQANVPQMENVAPIA